MGAMVRKETSLYWFLFRKFLWSKKGTRYLSIISVFSILGFAVGVCALVVVMSIMKGFQSYLRDNLRQISPDYIVYLNQNPDPDLLAQLRRTLPTATELSKYLSLKAFVLHESFGNSMLDVKLIEPEAQEKLQAFTLQSQIHPKAWLGSEAASRLLVTPGSRLRLSFPGIHQDPLGAIPLTMDLPVGGIVKTGVYTVDEQTLFLAFDQFPTHLVPSQWPLELHLRGKLSPTDLKNLYGLTFVRSVASWLDQNRALHYALKLEQSLMNAFLWLIIAVALTSVASLLLIFISDRRQSLGILMCLGLSSPRIQKMIASFGTWMGIFGTLAGLAFSAGILIWITQVQEIKLPNIYYHRAIPVQVDVGYISLVVISTLGFSTLISWLITRKLSVAPIMGHLSEDPVL
jgi:lipoprotein-releasing system permease protein